MSFQFGPFALDVARRQLCRHEDEVRLTPMAFNLLALLISEAPRVLTKRELHERLWPQSFVSDATLVGLVKELRRALDDRERHAAIRTVNRVGYSFAAPVESPTPPRSDARHWVTLVGGKRLLLQPGPNLIGRDPEATVWLDSASVSRRHAQIAVTANDARLEDLGSKNGTLVGGRPIAGAVVLKDGDQIAVGSVTVTYRTAATGASTETNVSREVS